MSLLIIKLRPTRYTLSNSVNRCKIFWLIKKFFLIIYLFFLNKNEYSFVNIILENAFYRARLGNLINIGLKNKNTFNKNILLKGV